MGQRTVQANGIQIWTESFGDPSAPKVLLVSGGATQAIGWSQDFIGTLVEGGRHVIRFDNRDVGLSSCFDFDIDPYTLVDMANDAAGVLDAYHVSKAHIVGPSMGGMIAQQLAIDHRDRVLTLTSMSSSPAGASASRAIFGLPPTDDLPPPTQEFLDAVLASLLRPPATVEERIDLEVSATRALSGSLVPFDEDHARSLFRRSLQRAADPNRAANHARMAATAPDRRASLRNMTAPTLVIHGTEDPVYPYDHGVAQEEVIPTATLHTIERLGHELPPVLHQEIAGLILAHTSNVVP